MERDPTPETGGTAGAAGEVMAAIEEESGVPRLVIADVSTDGSWVSAPAEASVPIVESR